MHKLQEINISFCVAKVHQNIKKYTIILKNVGAESISARQQRNIKGKERKKKNERFKSK